MTRNKVGSNEQKILHLWCLLHGLILFFINDKLWWPGIARDYSNEVLKSN